MAKTVTSYTHADAVFGGWKPGYLESYCESRAAAIGTGRKADNLWAWYLSDKLSEADDLLVIQAVDLLDRLAYAQWRDASYLWSEGENK